MGLRPSVLLDRGEEDPTFYVEDNDGKRLAEGFDTWDEGYNWILENRTTMPVLSVWERDTLNPDSAVWFMGDFGSYSEIQELVDTPGECLEDGFYEVVNSADKVVGVIWRGVFYVERR